MRREIRSQPLSVETTSVETTSVETAAIETIAAHAGREDLRRLGVHAPPLDLSSTYPLTSVQGAAAGLDAMVAGELPQDGNPIYGRLHNPTTGRFEQALAQLENASEAVAFASGMAALTATVLAAKQLGDGCHVVALRPLYGGSDHLLSSGLLDVETTWVDVEGVGDAIRPDTVLVVIETPANPTLQLIDIARVVEQAGDVPVVVDSTFATPVLQRPLQLGATLVLHSATKYLGGHGDVIAGVVATQDHAWAKALRQVRIVTGAVLHPLGAFLLHRGLATLPLRVRAAQAGAVALAARLAEHPRVSAVHYPGLPEGDPLQLIGRQMSGSGSMIAFEVEGGFDAACRVIEGVELMTPAVSLGSTDSLIQHPAAMTHRIVDDAVCRQTGITPGLLRLSVGIEDPEDLWRDLDSALKRALNRDSVTSRKSWRPLQPRSTSAVGC